MSEYKKNNINLFIFIFGLIFFFTKWYHPFVNFNEGIESKIIFESVSDGYYYFVPFKALANLNLNSSFDPLIKNLGTITIPTGAFILHFIFYSIIGSYSFVILEFIFILLFLIIFYKISRLLNLSRIQSLAASLILFNIPILFQMLNLDNLEYFRIIFSEFYSLRFQRPLVVNIFFFLFILLILKAEKKIFFTKKNFLIFGFITGLSFTSYFHSFILEQLVLIIFLIYKFKFQLIKKLQENINCIFYYILLFLIASLPFLINMNFASSDFLERNGLIIFDYEKKIILFKYLYFKLLKIPFLATLFFSIFILILINTKKGFLKLKKLNILFIIFYSSIISPFFFIIISPKFFSHFYHFNNLILSCTFLLFFFVAVLFTKFFLEKKLSVELINYIAFSLLLVLVIGHLYQSNKNYKFNSLSGEKFAERIEFNKIVNIIESRNILKKKDINLLTFDNKFFVWSVLNNIKYFNIVNGVLVPKTHEMIENDLINTFRYLKLSKNDFKEFIKNKKLSYWRYRNDNITNLFWMRYQANSMVTYKNSKNFDKEILEFIKKSSPLLSQQLAIPNEEFNRLILKFDTTNFLSFTNPSIIIIDKRHSILKKSIIDNKTFCKAFEGKIYDFYYSFNLNLNCNN